MNCTIDPGSDNNKKTSLISVVIPVYNGEKYIEECIKSIQSQTYKNLEILIINDGSTDSTASICNNLQKKDDRVTYISKENGGVSSARNIALSKLNGKYVIFVDADDWLNNNAIECFMENLNNIDADLVCSLYHEFGDNESMCRMIKCAYEGADIAKKLPEIWPYLMGPWGKLFQTRIIRENNLTFDESMPYGEDAVFNLNYVKYCKKVNIVDKVLYNHRIHAGGASNGIHYYEKMNEYLFSIYSGITAITTTIENSIEKNKINQYFYEILLGNSIEHYLLHKCEDREALIRKSLQLYGGKLYCKISKFSDKQNKYLETGKIKLFISDWYCRNWRRISKFEIKKCFAKLGLDK